MTATIKTFGNKLNKNGCAKYKNRRVAIKENIWDKMKINWGHKQNRLVQN